MNTLFRFVVKACMIMQLCFFSIKSNSQTNSPGNKDLPVRTVNDRKASVHKTKFGVLPSKGDISNRLTAANNLFSEYVRDQIMLSSWNGIKNTDVDYWLARQKKILLNINNDTTPSPFPKNLVDYESKLRSVLGVYGNLVELVVIENEELNRYDSTSPSTLYHTGSMMDYINQLTVAANVCTELGVPFTNGGLTNPIAASLKHYYEVNGKADSAVWINNVFKGIDPDSTRWLRTDSLLEAYRILPLDYVNLHWYEPQKDDTTTLNIIQTLCNYITQVTGKKVISNESGSKTTNPAMITSLMQQWDNVDVDYCIFWDGIGDEGAKPLTSESGVLLENGKAFRNYVYGSPACTNSINVSPAGPITVCNGQTVTLTAATGFGNYQWSNGATTRVITVTAPGNYAVVSNQGTCTAYPANVPVVQVNPLPPAPTITVIGSPLNVCPNKTVALSSSQAPSYLWSTGETTKNINVNAGTYTVTITDNNGCKNTSSPQLVTAQACLRAQNLRVTNIDKFKATLNWDTAICAIGYQLQYRVKGTIPWTTADVLGGKTSSRTILSLTLNTTYQWRMITACKISPDTVVSNFANGPEFTTLGNTAPCNPPTNLNVTNIELNKATLNWNVAANSNGYQIQYRVKGVGAWTVIDVAGGGQTSRTIFSLTVNTTYEWKMRTTCQNAADTISQFVNGPDFITLGYTAPCNPPTNLNVTNIDKFKATLNWDTAANSTGYELQYRVKNTGSWTIVSIVGAAQKSRTIFSLSAATTYEWRMKTKCKNAADTISPFALGPDFTTLAASFLFSRTDNDENDEVIIASLYPNPANGHVTLYIKNIVKGVKITLADVSGRILYQNEKVAEHNIAIPISKLSRGFYFVTISSMQSTKVLKLVKD